MTQYARPTSDVTVDSWTTTPLFEQLDEVTYSDTDYIQRNAVSYCEVGLNSITDPVSSINHVVNYRLGRSRDDRTLTLIVRLYQGSTAIASWTHTNPALSYVGFQQTLSGAQADAITNYADLRLRFDITSLQNSQVYGQVSWAELAVPDAVATDDLVAEDITAAAPILDEPTLARIPNLDPTDLTAAAPLLDEPTIGQEHVLTANDITAAAPLLDQPTIGQFHALVALELTASPPTLNEPIIAQIHALAGTELPSAAPTLSAPLLGGGTTDNLTADDITAGTPTLDIPIFGIEGIDQLFATDITAGTPTPDIPIFDIEGIDQLFAAEIFFATWNFEIPTLFAYTNTPSDRTSTPILATLSSTPPSAQRTSIPY